MDVVNNIIDLAVNSIKVDTSIVSIVVLGTVVAWFRYLRVKDTNKTNLEIARDNNKTALKLAKKGHQKDDQSSTLTIVKK